MKALLTLYVTLLTLNVYGQEYKTCYLYKYSTEDTIKKVSSVYHLDKKGRVIYEKSFGHYNDDGSLNLRDTFSTREQIIYNYGQGEDLVSKLEIYPDHNQYKKGCYDSLKINYYYDDKKQVTKIDVISYQVHIPTEQDWGLGIDDTVKTWKHTNTIYVSYDINKRVTEQLVYNYPYENESMLSKHIWIYDVNGRIVEKRTLTSGLLQSNLKETLMDNLSLWQVKNYVYHSDSCESIRYVINKYYHSEFDTLRQKFAVNAQGQLADTWEQESTIDGRNFPYVRSGEETKNAEQYLSRKEAMVKLEQFDNKSHITYYTVYEYR